MEVIDKNIVNQLNLDYVINENLVNQWILNKVIDKI